MKINSTKLFIFFLISLLLSCGQEVVQDHKDFDTVDFDLTKVKSVPDLNPQSTLGNYGPIDNKEKYDATNSKKKIVGLILGPGLYKSTLGLYAIDCMERYDKKISLISGIGFGAIIAALYAQGEKVETIKWMLYKHMNGVKDLKVFSGQWRRHWYEFIDDKINLKKLKESRISFWLPAYDHAQNSVHFSSKGDVIDILKQAINDKDPDYILKKEFLSQGNLKKLPVDKIILTSVIGSKLGTDNNFIYGLFTKAHSRIQKLKELDSVSLVEILTNENLDSSHFDELTNRDFCQKVIQSIE